ncbi:MAG: Wzz/FepE/Etk N-terminal domain-containing protein [Rikenellaceae bacterium]
MKQKRKEEKELDLIEIAQYIWHRRKLLIQWLVVGVVLGVVVAFSIPKSYVSTVKFATESKQQSSGLSQLGGLATMMGATGAVTTSGIDENLYPEILKSSPFLMEFSDIEVEYNSEKISLKSYLLEFQKKAWWSYIFALPAKLISFLSNKDREQRGVEKDSFRPNSNQLDFEKQLSSSISINQDKKTNLVEITVREQDGEIAAVLADSIISKLQKYMTLYFTSKTRSELEQSEQMLEKAKADYYSADTNYAQALDRNQNLSSTLAKARLSRMENERDLAFNIYEQIATKVEMIRIKIYEQTPIMTIIEPARVPLHAAEPDKKVIIVGFIFLSLFLSIIWLVMQIFLRGSSKEIF